MACGIQEGGVRYSLYPGIQDVPVHIRGSALPLGDVAPRRIPPVLAGPTRPLVRDGSGRRELALWLASPENPLTARVMVNRLWQYHFGEGLVRTSSNFGKLGEPADAPGAPRLAGPSLRREPLVRESPAPAPHGVRRYRQTCVPAGGCAELDPDNRLWSRFLRRRLEAEELRDSLLSCPAAWMRRSGDGRTRIRRASPDALHGKHPGKRSSFDVAFDAANPAAIVAGGRAPWSRRRPSTS
jgi:hypothetical protein